MRGLIAAVLLAPALTSALVVPNTWHGDDNNDAVRISKRSVRPKVFGIDIPVPNFQTPDGTRTLNYRLAVALDPSGPECGSGHIIINDDPLPYKQGEELRGEHTGLINEQLSIETKWEITCGQPQPAIENSVPPLVHSVKIFVDEINSQPVTDVGVTIRYTQVDGEIEILDRTPFENTPNVMSVIHGPTSVTNAVQMSEVRIGEMYKRLKFLVIQKHEFKRLIREQKAMIAEETRMTYGDAGLGVLHCKSVKCVFKVALHDCKQAMKHAKSKFTSAFSDRGRHGKHGKHGCSHPAPPRGDHPYSPPHRKPHFLAPPFTPQSYRLRAHHGPPPQGRPPHGPPYDRPPHRLPPFNRPPSDGQPHRSPFDRPPSDTPPSDGPPNFIHSSPSHFERPSPIESGRRSDRPWYQVRHPYILASFLLLLASVLLRIYIKLHRRAARLDASMDTSCSKRPFKRHSCFRRCRQKAQQKRQGEREYSEKDDVLPFHEPHPLYSDRSHITAEIGQLRTAAAFVDEMVSRASSEEERGPSYARRSSTSTMATLPEYRERDADCKVAEEELPVYEIGDGSEEGSIVANGFGYAPTAAEVWRARVDGVDVKV